MIGLVLRLVRARRRRAVGVGLLAAFVIAVCVAAPAYLTAADRAITTAQIGSATLDEISVSVDTGLDLRNGRDRTFEQNEPAKLTAPWLSTVFSADIDVITSGRPGADQPASYIPELVFRQDYCAHVTLIAGRCPVAVREVLIDKVLADSLRLGVGSTFPLSWARFSQTDGWSPAGPSLTLSVVGVYQPTDPNEPYWGNENYFTIADGDRGGSGPLLTNIGTVETVVHQGQASTDALAAPEVDEHQHVDATIRPGALDPTMFPAVRRFLATLTGPDAVPIAYTQIPQLLDRIDADRATIRQIVPAVAVPLVVLGCLVLFLVVAHAAADRRPEVAVARLRGAGRLDRWTVATGESLVPVVLAVPVGVAVGWLLAWATTRATLPGAPAVPLGVGRPLLSGVVLVAMLVVVAAAYRRVLAEPVSEVIRAVPARRSAWRSYTLEALIVVLAGAAVVELRAQKGSLAGLMLGAPALVVTAVAVVVGWLVPPIVTRLGARSLAVSGHRRRARLAVGLGALTLARRPGAQRLLAIQAIALGLVGFVAAAAANAASARSARVATELGAYRVLTVAAHTPLQLLDAVRKADPSGRYAMAAVTVRSTSGSGGGVLAVDASRLAAVATWPTDAGTKAATVAALLDPPAPAAVGRSLLVTGVGVALTVSADFPGLSGPPPTMSATFAPVDGSADVVAPFGPLDFGTHTYSAQVGPCAVGCRLVGLTVLPQGGTVGVIVNMTLLRLEVTRPARANVPLPSTVEGAWRLIYDLDAGAPPVLIPRIGGLIISSIAELPASGMTIVPQDAPYPLPAVGSGVPRNAITGLDGGPVEITDAGHATDLPRLGTQGTLVDLGTLDKLSTGPVSSFPAAEVWLAADAPASVQAALEKGGIHVTGVRDQKAEAHLLSQQGTALGYLFALVAAAAAVLLATGCVALLAAVDRRRRVAELGSLRVQGLRVAVARRATVVAQLGLVVLAGITGGAGGAAAWMLAGAHLPIFSDEPRVTAVATSAPWSALLFAVIAGTVLLGVAALGVAVDVGRRVSDVQTGPRPVARRGEGMGSAL